MVPADEELVFDIDTNDGVTHHVVVVAGDLLKHSMRREADRQFYDTAWKQLIHPDCELNAKLGLCMRSEDSQVYTKMYMEKCNELGVFQYDFKLLVDFIKHLYMSHKELDRCSK
jgi:hypothetical protein